ncbi:MAG: ABC transporter substrate-binding protein [Actinobacteria bacterium]|nr:ABC transporter substrate-binding protein [Actinomycetota bacterium]
MLLTIGALTAFAAGCGSGDSTTGGSETSENGSSASGSSTAATKEPTGTPITVAAFVDESGPNNGGQGDTADVMQAWANSVNAKGGLANHPVKVEVHDSRGNPSTAASLAQEAVKNQAVSAVILVDAAADAAAAKPLSAAGLPVIGGNGFNPEVWGATPENKIAPIPPMENVFGVSTGFPANAAGFIEAPKNAGYKSIAAVDFSTDPASKQATELVQHLAPEAGLEFKVGITIDPTAPDYTAQCLELVQENVEYTILTMPDATAKRFVGDCKTQGYSGAIGAGAGLVTPTFYESLEGTKLMGGLTAFPWFAEAAPVKRYRSLMEEDEVPEEEWARGDSTATWTTLELFHKALEDNAKKLSGAVTREDVLAAYHTIKNETLGGLLPEPVTYTKGQPAQVSRCSWLYSYEDGKFTGSYKATCPNPNLGLG